MASDQEVIVDLQAAIAEFRKGIQELQLALHGDHETISLKYLAERINRLEDKLERTSVACTDQSAQLSGLKNNMCAVNERLDRAALAIKPLLAIAADKLENKENQDATATNRIHGPARPKESPTGS